MPSGGGSLWMIRRAEVKDGVDNAKTLGLAGDRKVGGFRCRAAAAIDQVVIRADGTKLPG